MEPARAVTVTMSDVAKVACVSKNTVSLALNGSLRLPRSTRDRIRKIASRLGYQKNPTVAHLMAQIQCSRTPRFTAALALINANTDRKAFRDHPTIPTYITGCRVRASELGYRFDEFWLHDPELSSSRLSRVLKSRNIRGGIIVGMMNTNQLPSRFNDLWTQFPFVVTGVRTQNPTLSFCCADHHACALKAFEWAIQLGYRRPALVLDHVIDELLEGRFSSGVFVAQQQLPVARRARAFHLVNEARENPALFETWLKKEKPDIILTLYHVVREWLTMAGLRVPNDVGLIQLEWRPDHRDWAGIDQHNDVVGATAVDMLVGMIHRGETGVPIFPRATLIGGSWIDGKTVQRNASGERKVAASEATSG